MTVNFSSDVVIVGGGPSGLSLAYYLDKNNIDYVILEKHKVGHSWENMPEYWRVVSPQWTNTLPGSTFPFFSPFKKPFVNTYRDYLLKYVKKNKLNIIENTNINSVSLNDNSGTFLLNAGNANLKCNVLVSATGYFSNPFIPNLKNGNDISIESFHVSNYKCPEDVAKKYPNCKKILIVGRRVSAGQLMIDLTRFGFSVSVSARGELCPRDGSLKGKIKDFIYFPYEEVKVKFQPRINSNSFPHMDGGETEYLLKQGSVFVYPNLTSIKDGFVNFEDGTREYFDLVIFATGFKPSLNYLGELVTVEKETGLPCTSGMQCTNTPNLFFIGLDQLYNFRSRYLRGIRRDAKILSNTIKINLDNNS